MTFGQDPKPAVVSEPLTTEIAAELFEALKTASPTTVYTSEENASKYEWSHIVAVVEEFKRLAGEFGSYMNGKVITAEESHYEEETGEKVIDVAEVRYNATTETDLLAQVSSDILDAKKVLNEIEPGGIWADYVASYKTTI